MLPYRSILDGLCCSCILSVMLVAAAISPKANESSHTGIYRPSLPRCTSPSLPVVLHLSLPLTLHQFPCRSRLRHRQVPPPSKTLTLKPMIPHASPIPLVLWSDRSPDFYEGPPLQRSSRRLDAAFHAKDLYACEIESLANPSREIDEFLPIDLFGN